MKGTSPDIVGEIKAIVFQDKRERLAAGYRYGSRGLSERIAEAYGISVHTVHSIRDGYRHRKTPSHKQLLKGYTVPPERLERLRQYNERRPEHRAETPRPKLRHYYHRFLMNQR